MREGYRTFAPSPAAPIQRRRRSKRTITTTTTNHIQGRSWNTEKTVSTKVPVEMRKAAPSRAPFSSVACAIIVNIRATGSIYN